MVDVRGRHAMRVSSAIIVFVTSMVRTRSWRLRRRANVISLERVSMPPGSVAALSISSSVANPKMLHF